MLSFKPLTKRQPVSTAAMRTNNATMHARAILNNSLSIFCYYGVLIKIYQGTFL